MKQLIDYYSAYDEWGRLDREPLEYLVNMHHIRGNLPESGRILDNGAGPGKYSVELAKAGYRVTLADLTPRLVETAERKAEEEGVRERFDGFHALDARDLSGLPDENFDAALMLGPLYHLQEERDRRQAVGELHRVTKPGGIVFVAFMPRTAFLRTSLERPLNWKPNHTAAGLDKMLDTGAFEHEDEGRFTGAYYFDIDDIRPFMEEQGFESVKLIASASLAGSMDAEQWDYWRGRGEEEFAAVMRRVIQVSESPYILGTSSHLLYIGRRK
ncbi:class I SAM-dependent methyltransferase [Saccharibacillus sp. CPCC 101409]|uniref:class I SAM-dependent methyltransferase n=1 Tax=Saccharibacillus sp. CPCC 101409 TaxID=3058041 RepID=UPI002672B3C8|nr:class I SAM-dependent methyltransferase [Saccharibacillus sp. CPCC 101409]MDO3412512.1 class I SAM-dependent methyltransferase [Saccharibacillus sp. CPCC 101409]